MCDDVMIHSPMDCLASYYKGYYCDMYGDGCYATQTCDLSYYNSTGCGMCMGNYTTTTTTPTLSICIFMYISL